MSFIICTRQPTGIETWINCTEIAAIVEFNEGEKVFSRIILKNGKELIVEDRADDIHGGLIQQDSDSSGYYV